MSDPSTQADQGANNDRLRQQAVTQSGNNYQAGGNMYINEQANTTPKKESVLTNFNKIVGSAAGIVALCIAAFITVPNACNSDKQNQKSPLEINEKKSLILISGIIRDLATKKGIENAVIKNNLNLSDSCVTTTDGTFEFKVSGISGSSIRIYVSATGYSPRNEWHPLGAPIDIELDKK
jgi:hypothetical protein